MKKIQGLCFSAALFASPVQASEPLDLSKEVTRMANACVMTIENDLKTLPDLRQYQYVRAGKGFKKAPYKSPFLATGSSVKVVSRNSKKSTSCTITVSSLMADEARSLFKIYGKSVERQGYKPVQLRYKSGAPKGGFQKGNLTFESRAVISNSFGMGPLTIFLVHRK